MIDLQKVQEQFQVDRNFVLILLDELKVVLENELPDFKKLLEAKSLYELSRLAHKHKASAFSLSVSEIGETLQSIELHAKSGQNTEQIQKEINNLELLLESFHIELHNIKNVLES